MIYGMVKDYFQFLTGNKDSIVTTCWMNKTEGVVKGYSSVHGKVSELPGIWQEIGSAEPTLHTTLNATTLIGGRKTADIEHPRVFCVDMDREVSSDELEQIKEQYTPGLIVESSPSKYHLYWHCPAGVSLEQWRQIQVGLAFQFTGDYNISNVTSLIRVPGFKRLTKAGSPYIPHPVFLPDGVQYSEVNIMEWAGLTDLIEKGTAARKEMYAKAYSAAKNARNGNGVDRKIEAAEGRNVTLYIGVKEFVINYGADNDDDAIELAVFEAAEKINDSFMIPLDDKEVAATVKSAIQHGLEVRRKKAAHQEELLDMLKPTNTIVDSLGLLEVTKDDLATPMAMPEIIKIVDDILETPKDTGAFDIELTDAKLLDCNSAEVIDAPELLTTPEAKTAKSSKEVAIPDCVYSAAKKLCTLLLNSDMKRTAELVSASIEVKNTEYLAEHIVNHFTGVAGSLDTAVGCLAIEGPSVFVATKSVWGSTVNVGYPCGKEEIIAFVSRVVLDFCHAAMQVEAYSKLIKELPSDRLVNAMGLKVWAVMLLSPRRRRQAENIVVFQNGVLNLDSGAFTEDALAAIRHSNPIHAKLDVGTAVMFEQCQEREWSGTFDFDHLLQAACPVFRRFLNDWFPGDVGIWKVLINWFGYSMTTSFFRQKFLFFYGPTRAGKGSLCRVLAGLVGDNNFCSSDYNALDGAFKVAEMHNRLVVSVEESEAGFKDTERRLGYLKKLLGGERVMFERKYCNPFQDYMIGKFIFQTNEIPNYQDKGNSLRSRMIAVGFERSFENGISLGVDPAKMILGSFGATGYSGEADRVATLCALMWSEGTKDVHVFKPVNSRAIEVGYSEVIESLDIPGLAIGKYLVAAKDGQITSKALSELIKYMFKKSGKDTPAHLDRMINKGMQFNYPKAIASQHTFRATYKDSGKRGFIGVKFNRESILLGHPELEDSSLDMVAECPSLIQELGLIAKDSIL
jgi:hypothetical protein